MDPVTAVPQQTATPATTDPAQPNNPSSAPDDLVARASAISVSPDKPVQDDGFDRKEYETYIASVQDPKAKDLLEKAYKSLQTGAQKKFQEAAELKRQAESATRRPHVSELIKDPTFVAEVQEYQRLYSPSTAPKGSNLSDEEYSALTDAEKQQFQQIQQQNQQLQSQMSEIIRTQEDERIKGRYKNYDPTVVNKVVDDVLARRINITREHVWRAHDYEDYGKRCYQLGLQDRNGNIAEKVNANSFNGGVNITPADQVPAKQPGQSNIDYFKQIALRRLQQHQQANGRK